MFKLFLQGSTESVLRKVATKDVKSFVVLKESITEIRNKGTKASQVKKLKAKKSIYRKRCGRWRILFTVQGQEVFVWVIAKEKDIKKDYMHWIQYISFHAE